MAPQRRHWRFLAPFVAVTLAVELSVGALAIGPSAPSGPAQPPVAALGNATPTGAELSAARYTTFHGGVPGWASTTGALSPGRLVVPSSPTPANSVPNVAIAAVPKPAVAPKPVKSVGSSKPAEPAPAPAYRGRNHIWIPALGVSRSVSFYSCSRKTPLANVVYRWGCAGNNNVYLMGHASGVFRVLNNAYANGRLRKGMQVIYADANGRVTRYRVTFWKLVSPVGQGWAFAALAQPSLTLQTCVGAGSKYRLVVRLVATG